MMKDKIEEETTTIGKNGYWENELRRLLVMELKLNNKQHDRKSLTEVLAHVRIHFF
jgi:hypothetical protein